MNASQRKSTQVIASPPKWVAKRNASRTQVVNLRWLAPTCDSVWPGLYHLRRSMPLQRSCCIENRTHETKPSRSAYESGCETAKGTTVSCHNFNLTRMPSIFCQVWISEFPWVNNSAQSALLKTIVWSVVEGADKTPTSHQQKPQTSEFEAEVYLIYRTPLWVF